MQAWGDCLVEGTDIATLRCLPVVLANVISAALIFSGIVAVIFIIWAGARYVWSGGDQKKVDSARKTLTFAILGLILILMAFIIVNFLGFLTGTQGCINQLGFEWCK